MKELQTYNQMTVKIEQSAPIPNYLTSLALKITQAKDLSTALSTTPNMLAYLIDAGHLSVIEHCSATFLIKGASRSLLAQLTRHRMASYTVGSQHYQNYTDYPYTVHMNMSKEPIVVKLFEAIDKVYDMLIQNGHPVWEARQILPNAKTCNILFTINARSLINFLNQRLCKRNVPEMQILAQKIQHKAIQWWPTLFNLVGPDCKMRGCCTQGRMQANECKKTSKC
jgi:thymidylate synthase (FAD)